LYGWTAQAKATIPRFATCQEGSPILALFPPHELMMMIFIIFLVFLLSFPDLAILSSQLPFDLFNVIWLLVPFSSFFFPF
jgi:hypothetical protein